jgi:hypothetical protein
MELLKMANLPGTDNEAVSLGYTRHVIASSDQHEFACLIQPDADLDDVVKVFNTDDQEWLRLNGWLFTFEEA